jgi:hypothetical protein
MLIFHPDSRTVSIDSRSILALVEAVAGDGICGREYLPPSHAGPLIFIRGFGSPPLKRERRREFIRRLFERKFIDLEEGHGEFESVRMGFAFSMAGRRSGADVAEKLPVPDRMNFATSSALESLSGWRLFFMPTARFNRDGAV